MRRITLIFLSILCTATLTFFVVSANTKPAAKEITFSKHVAPIFNKACTECHRPGEAAPFSTLTYKDVRPWAKSIREKVATKVMPPWHADPNHGTFKNDRRLSQAEIDTVVAWVDGGAKEGNPKDMPAAPKFVDGWSIGKPDQAFSIPEQTIPANGVVKYQYVQVQTNFTEDKFIQAAEVRSTGRAAVHHVIVFITPANGKAEEDSGLLAGYAPGEQPAIFPTGYAKRVPAGAKLTFQLHYTPNGNELKDVTTVGLVFAKQPVEHELKTRPVMQNKFVIPAGAANHEVASKYVFKQDVHITSFMPHMHLRGKDFLFTAVTPEGKSNILLSVPKYDFSWQTVYIPTNPVAIAKGTRIDCLAHFDNSTNNKANPDPTKDVRWGDQTFEEMMIGWLTYYYDTPEVAKSVASAK